MLFIVAGIYLLLFFIDTPNAIEALHEDGEILTMVAPIILVVFFLMGLLDLSIDKEKISKHFGKDSGIRGWIIALVAGILSHGPAYVWYPLLENLRQKGAKDSLVVAFLYARSIKIPWIPLMISYFGWIFTLVFSLFILLGAWIQGIIVEIIQSRWKKM